MSENWLSIKGYECLYEVSNLGRVRNVRTGRVLRFNNKYGYLYITLYKDKKIKSYRVHRLVAMTFIPNPDGLPEVNHIDENKENNRVDNLEWCDGLYNSNYGTRNERISKKVYMYTLDGNLCGMWPSTMECGRHGFDYSGIARCCRGERRTYKGYKWSYEPPVPPKAI